MSMDVFNLTNPEPYFDIASDHSISLPIKEMETPLYHTPVTLLENTIRHDDFLHSEQFNQKPVLQPKPKQINKKRRTEDQEKKRSILKQPKTAWIIYLQEKKSQNPEMTWPILCKTYSKEWKSLSLEEKRPFIDAETKQKLDYQEEKKQLNPYDKKILKSILRKKRKAKNQIRHPRNAYNFFVKDLKNEVTNETFENRGKMMSQLWKDLPLDKKEYYQTLAKNDLIRYNANKKRVKRKYTKYQS